MIIYSILRGTKGDGREVRSIVPSKHFSFFYHPFSFFLLPFFHKSRPQSGYRNRLETDEIPRVSATSGEFSSFALPLLPSLPPDNIHDTLWIISGRMVDIETCFLARLLNGAEVEARSDRGYESTIIAKCRRMPWARLLCALRDCARMVLVGASYRLCYTRIRVVGVYTLGRFAHVRIQCRSVDFDDGIGIRFDLLWKGYSHQV